MPSPFPGVDPFIEQQEWQDFHTTFNTVIREQIALRLDSRYLVRVERRVYVEPAELEEPPRWADVAVLLTDDDAASGTSAAVASSSNVATVECEIPMPLERRETYLVIREAATMKIITVIETLSPANKRSGSIGRRKYLRKRNTILETRTHLVELDLLRGGQRLPMNSLLPRGDFYAIISRGDRRPRATVFAWTLRDAVPTIPIPLKKGDPDVSLDLQAACSTVYDRARYDRSLKYASPLVPPLSPADADWMAALSLSRTSGR